MSGNCQLCEIPTKARLCNSCIRYLNKLGDKEFADVAVRSFGKTRKEADAWLEAKKGA